MNKSIARFSLLLTTILFTSGCTLLKKSNDQIKTNGASNDVMLTESIQITISCNQDSIQTYIEKGWAIEGQVTREIPCTWKTIKANKKCNLKKDKGCAVTVPDMLGKQTIYTLTKDKKYEAKD